MQPRFVDLHTHTTASDGTDAPRDLIRRAASLKLAAVAVTDHDTVSGLDEAEAAGREYGVEIIRGCELGVQGQYGEIHLLGLWLPRHSAPLDAELARLRGHREERNLKILDRLRSIGINIGYQEVLDEAGGESPACSRNAVSCPISRRPLSCILAITVPHTCPGPCSPRKKG